MDWACFAEGACLEYVGDVFVVGGEHEVCFASAVGLCLPSGCLYIVLCHVFLVDGFLVGVFGVVFCCVCWMLVWYGAPVLGSYFVAVASALSAFLRACWIFLGLGRLCKAPSAYGVPEPMA